MKKKNVSFVINEKYYRGVVINVAQQVMQSFAANFQANLAKINEALASSGGQEVAQALQDFTVEMQSSLGEVESLCDLALDLEEQREPEELVEDAKKKMNSR